MFRAVVLISALIVLSAIIMSVHGLALRLTFPARHAAVEGVVVSPTSIPHLTAIPMTVLVVTLGPQPTATTVPHREAPPAPQEGAGGIPAAPGAPQEVAASIGGAARGSPVQPLPTASPTPGTIRIVNYWIGRRTVRRGELLSLSYVLDNETGGTLRLWLGASIMPATGRNWLTQSLSDRSHDVIATIPPGITTHLRYFLIPPRAPAGLYDVAWGLSTLSRQSVTFVAAPRLLSIDQKTE